LAPRRDSLSSTSTIPSLEGARGPQDARILPRTDGTLVVWFNANSLWRPSRVTQQFAVVGAGGAWSEVRETKEVKLSNHVFEKNFVPFEYGGGVLFAYTLEPHQIFRLNELDGTVLQVATSANKHAYVMVFTYVCI
jgi:hypothetical protein